MKHHLVQLIKEQADKYGSRVALRYRDQNQVFKDISWADFHQSTIKIAKAIIASGFNQNSNIGIYSDNRPEWTIADIAILSTRSVVVPVFSNTTISQLQYIIEETSMELLFVGNLEQYQNALSLIEVCPSLKQIVVFDSSVNVADLSCFSYHDFLDLGDGTDWEKQLQVRLENLDIDDLATIVYTSGTTGDQKGVMLKHRNFIQCFKIHDLRLPIDDSDVSLCFLPLSHIFERTWTFYMLYKGAVNVYLENPREVINVLPLVKPTLMCTVPRFFEKTLEGILLEKQNWSSVKQKIFDWAIKVGHAYSKYQSEAKPIPYTLEYQRKLADKLVLKKLRGIFGGNIKFIPCSGAAASPELLRFFHAIGIFVCYGYGATETTATVSCFPTDKFSFDTCGKIMPEVEVKIGENNEIMVKGKTVFCGYYHKPEETAKVLVDGWYKTGDSGSIPEEGLLIMKDRIRDIFKTSGGKYVSPQRVELHVSRDPVVEQVMTIGDNRKYITALIVPSMPNLKNIAKSIGKGSLNNNELVKDDLIIEHLHKRFEKVQKDLSPYERVVKFVLLSEPFTIENKSLTTTLKVRRRIVMDRYKDVIEKMYGK